MSLINHELFQQNGIKEDMQNVSMRQGSIVTIVPPMNESRVPLIKARRRDYTKLDRLEAGLRRARAAIKEAKHGNQTQDPDYAPVGPIYRRANTFYRYPSVQLRFTKLCAKAKSFLNWICYIVAIPIKIRLCSTFLDVSIDIRIRY